MGSYLNPRRKQEALFSHFRSEIHHPCDSRGQGKQEPRKLADSPQEWTGGNSRNRNLGTRKEQVSEHLPPAPRFTLTALSTHSLGCQKMGRAITALSTNVSPRCQKGKRSRGHNSLSYSPPTAQKPLSHRPERCVLFRDGRGQS